MNGPARLVVTSGEPAGIGPDICIQLAQTTIDVRLAFLADPQVIQQRADLLGLDINLVTLNNNDEIPIHQAGDFPVFGVTCPEPVEPGKLNSANAQYVLGLLNTAIDLASDNRVDAMITAPVHKGIINDAGIAFTGHTEWLAQRTNTPLPVMMLASPELKVALATTHLPLQNVSQAITRDLLSSVIHILYDDLIGKFNIEQPRIRVCGLNPHAGEDGHLGREEVEIITPVLEALRQQGMQLEGPVPADTAFLPDSLANTDAVLAMYHDQGLPVLKYSDFEHAVNITLGLPIIRISVDHGTALELAGSGKASHTSLLAAIQMAVSMLHKDR